MSEQIIIGISDRKISTSPNTLVTYALGSCIGISLYDPSTNIGGMAHIMLPDSGLVRSGEVNRMKFADTAIEDLANEMVGLGADKERITAKIAGGANMFKIADGSPVGSIGDRNVSSVRSELTRLGIPIVGEDVGEDFGRTLHFDLGTGKVRVQSLGKNIKEM